MKYFSLLKKISFVSAGNLFNALFGLVFLTASARILSVEDFGKYALYTSFLVFMSKVVDFGSNAVFVAEALKAQHSKSLITQFYLLKLMLFVLAAFFSLVALFVLGVANLFFVVTFLFGLVFYSVNVTLFAIYQSLEKFTYAILLNTIPAAFKALVGTVILFGYANLNLEQLTAVFSLSMGLCLILYFFLPKEFKVFNLKSIFNPNIYELFKSSAPAGVSQLISQGWPAISNSIVKIYKSFSDVGLFYLADKVANVFNLISISIFTVILPKNAKRKRENLPHDLRESMFLGSLIFILALVFVSVSEIFVKRVFGDKFMGSLLILDILVISSAVSAIHAFMENYFYVHDSTKTIMYISLLKLFVFIIFSLFLVPYLALKGLAFAQLVSSVFGLSIVIYILVAKNQENKAANV